jgi:hypothetical protein
MGSIVRIAEKSQRNNFILSMRSLFTVHDSKHVIQRFCMTEVAQTAI